MENYRAFTLGEMPQFAQRRALSTSRTGPMSHEIGKAGIMRVSSMLRQVPETEGQVGGMGSRGRETYV
jgi:hypothetical protein